MTLKKILEKNKKTKQGSDNYNYQCKIVHRDNKDICNYNYNHISDGSFRIRIPSLKRPISTWKRFYSLYPILLKRLKEGEAFDGQTEINEIIIVKRYCINDNYRRIRTLKFKKIW